MSHEGLVPFKRVAVVDERVLLAFHIAPDNLAQPGDSVLVRIPFQNTHVTLGFMLWRDDKTGKVDLVIAHDPEDSLAERVAMLYGTYFSAEHKQKGPNATATPELDLDTVTFAIAERVTLSRLH